LKGKLSYVSLCLAICFVSLSFASIKVNASPGQVVMDDMAPFYSAQWGGGGEEWSASANVNDGYHYSYCGGNSYAQALVAGYSHYYGSNINKIAIYVTIKNAHVERHPFWLFGGAEVKLWVWLYDKTAKQQLFEGFKDYETADEVGYCYIWTDVSANIQYDHEYVCWAGVKVDTWRGWFGGWSWAQGYGYLYRTFICQWPL